jgi:hypothetical protein
LWVKVDTEGCGKCCRQWKGREKISQRGCICQHDKGKVFASLLNSHTRRPLSLPLLLPLSLLLSLLLFLPLLLPLLLPLSCCYCCRYRCCYCCRFLVDCCMWKPPPPLPCLSRCSMTSYSDRGRWHRTLATPTEPMPGGHRVVVALPHRCWLFAPHCRHATQNDW